jgi:uncharacterized SAM-binding protein YcdF (DUF218 family)
MKWDRFTMGIGTVAIVFVLVVVITPITNIAGRAFAVEPDLRTAGAIVVLGSGLKEDGSLTYESQQRLLFGLRLYKEGLAPILVLSGPGRPDTAPEATVRARIAVEMGVPVAKIFELPKVDTTRDEAQQTAKILKPLGVNHVLIVTESMHMRRSKAVFEAAGLTVSAAPSDNLPSVARSPLDRLDLCAKLLMHASGLFYYRLAGYI